MHVVLLVSPALVAGTLRRLGGDGKGARL